MAADALVVAPYAGGHHAEYLRWTVAALRERGAAVSVAAHPALLDAEADALAGADARPLDVTALEAAGSLWATGRETAAVIDAAVREARAPSAFVPYLDHAQLGLATGLRFGFPVRLSGILLRVTAHEPAVGLGARLRRLRKTALLRLAARNPHLGPVLALDPDAVAPLRRFGLDARWLPDPVEPPAPSRAPEAVRAALGVEPGRRLLLLFGSLEPRKGVYDVLGALAAVPAEAAARLTVAVIGTSYPDSRRRLHAAVDAARETPAQVVVQERFVPDDELDDLVAAADVVLAPYRGHVGSSGVVLRAAAAGRPLLATAEGMVGREVRRHRLGQAVDVADRAALAAALAAAPGAGFDADAAAAYAAAHTVERFGAVIAEAVL